MSLAEEKQQLETLLRQVKSIQSLSAILPPYAQGIDIYTACVSALQAVLANLLKYHVVSGTVVSSALKDGQTITSIATNGANTFKFVAAGTKLSTGPGSVGATITTADVLGTNGVVHVSH